MCETNTNLVANMGKDIEALRRRRVEIEKRHETETKGLFGDIEAIRKRIQTGEATSGDRITDFLLVTYGVVDHVISLPFREMEKQLAGKKGEIFLVVRREMKRHVFRGCFGGEGSRDSDFHLETTHTIGLVSADQLVLEAGGRKCGLPTVSHVELITGRPMDKKQGPLLFDVHEPHELGRVVHAGHDFGRALEILIGDKAVFEYSPKGFSLVRQDWVVALCRGARMLGKDLPEAPEEKAVREEEEQNVLARLDKTRDTYKRFKNNAASPADLWKCKRELVALLTRAKELGLKNKPIVQLVEEDMNVG